MPADGLPYFSLGLNGALIERQEIVVPVTVSVGANVRRTAGGAYDANVGTLACVGINNKESVSSSVDAADNIFAAPFPARLGIPQVRDVLMRALWMGLTDARHPNICHD